MSARAVWVCFDLFPLSFLPVSPLYLNPCEPGGPERASGGATAGRKSAMLPSSLIERRCPCLTCSLLDKGKMSHFKGTLERDEHINVSVQRR